jgi:hypothetical protein
LIGLTFYAEFHNVVPADCAVVNDNIPSPKRHRVPLWQVSQSCRAEWSSKYDTFLISKRGRLSPGSLLFEDFATGAASPISISAMMSIAATEVSSGLKVCGRPVIAR